MLLSPVYDVLPRCRGSARAQSALWGHTVGLLSADPLHDDQTESWSVKQACRKWLSHCRWLWSCLLDKQRSSWWDLCRLLAPLCQCASVATNNRYQRTRGWRDICEHATNDVVSLTNIRSAAVCRISSTSCTTCFVETDPPRLTWGPVDESGRQRLWGSSKSLMLSSLGKSDTGICVMSSRLGELGE